MSRRRRIDMWKRLMLHSKGTLATPFTAEARCDQPGEEWSRHLQRQGYTWADSQSYASTVVLHLENLYKDSSKFQVGVKAAISLFLNNSLIPNSMFMTQNQDWYSGSLYTKTAPNTSTVWGSKVGQLCLSMRQFAHTCLIDNRLCNGANYLCILWFL